MRRPVQFWLPRRAPASADFPRSPLRVTVENGISAEITPWGRPDGKFLIRKKFIRRGESPNAHGSGVLLLHAIEGLNKLCEERESRVLWVGPFWDLSCTRSFRVFFKAHQSAQIFKFPRTARHTAQVDSAAAPSTECSEGRWHYLTCIRLSGQYHRMVLDSQGMVLKKLRTSHSTPSTIWLNEALFSDDLH